MLLKAQPEDFVVEELPQQWVLEGEKGPYTYFRLTKRDLTTEEAIRRIAKRLGRERKLFGYAGAKDRRALTTQYCSVRGPLHPLEEPGLKAEPCGAGNEPLSLGQLLGNRFTIRVREAPCTPEPMANIPNYFDEQRFGVNGDNLRIGEALLRRDFRSAAELAMESAHIRDAGPLMERNDWVGALRLIPKKTLLFYLHSVQSALFNRLLDAGIRLHAKEFSEIDIPHCGRMAVPSTTADMERVLPIVGFGTDLSTEKEWVRSAATELLKGAVPRDFLIRQMPEVSGEGSQRETFVQPAGLRISAEGEDVLLSLTLPPGSYATIAVKALFATNPR